jgi:hypothetical protein
MEFLWGLLTLLLYRSPNARYIYGLRFMIGELSLLSPNWPSLQLRSPVLFHCCLTGGQIPLRLFK